MSLLSKLYKINMQQSSSKLLISRGQMFSYFKWIESKEELESIWIDYIDLLNESINDNAILGFDSNQIKDLEDRYRKYLFICLELKLLQILIVYKDTNSRRIIATCQIKKSFQDTSSHIADIQKGIVSKEFRGDGLARNTLIEVAKKCIDSDIDLLTLDVRKNTSAQYLWLSYGFKEYGVLKSYSRFKGVEHEGVYLYQKSQDLLDTLDFSTNKRIEV